MRRLELTVVAAVGGTTAFPLTEKFGKDFIFFGAFVPLVITLAAALRYTGYFFQFKRIRMFMVGKET